MSTTNPQGVLSSLLAEDRPWTVEEMIREKGNRLEVVDAIAELARRRARHPDQQARDLRLARRHPSGRVEPVMSARLAVQRRSHGGDARPGPRPSVCRKDA